MAPMSVYVGGLSEDTQKEDLEREFGQFGNLIKVWVARNPPGFAFIEFKYDMDANEAIRELDGIMINGSRITVAESRSGSKRGRGRGGRGSGFCGDRRGFGGGRGNSRGFAGGRDHSFDSGFRPEGRSQSYGDGDYDGGSRYRSRSPVGQGYDHW